MSKHILCGIALAVLLLSECASNPDVQLVELSKNTVVYDEIVRINNCGGKGDSEQTKSRDFATNVEFGAGVSAGYQSIVQGSLSAKYSEYRNTSVSQRLVAPPGTNMEFVLRWSDDVRAGNVQVNGKSGTYEVRIPISVEQVSSRDLGCGISAPIQPIPTVVVERVTPTVIVSLKYDETAGVHLVQGQTQLVATYLRQVQAGGSLEEAIQSIKQQAANARATTQEGNTITVQMGQAYFVWCPSTDCIYPTNTSFPLQGFRQDYLKVAVIELGKERVVQCPSTCWAVAIH